MPRETEFTDETLNETPGRAVKFLGVIGRTSLVWALLKEQGYTQKEHDLGWSLLHRAANFVPAGPAVEVDEEARAALAYVDNWEEPNLRRHRSALVRLHPTRVEFLFEGLEFATGAASLLNVERYLDRVDRLESGEARDAADRAEDRRTLATLETRGLKKEVRRELREKIAVAKGLPDAPGPVASGLDKDAHREALLALKLWFEDWAETARTVIKRRDVLIRMGLAERKDRRPKDEK